KRYLLAEVAAELDNPPIAIKRLSISADAIVRAAVIDENNLQIQAKTAFDVTG
ncbi:hypothetical protein ADUPG1_004773, partial [Aduncisulcus paluster]